MWPKGTQHPPALPCPGRGCGASSASAAQSERGRSQRPPGNVLLPASPGSPLTRALCWALGKMTRLWCLRSTCWWSLRMPTAPATSGRSPWTSPMTSSATVPPTATMSGGLGSGQGWGRAGAGQGARLTPAPHPSPTSSSQFCRDAATSLSLFYNNGARPCGCHEVGAMSPTCEPFGGQCPCRAHVIGRDCSRCATGYWGFPNCRREYLSPRARQRGGWCLNPGGLPGGGGVPPGSTDSGQENILEPCRPVQPPPVCGTSGSLWPRPCRVVQKVPRTRWLFWVPHPCQSCCLLLEAQSPEPGWG